MIMALDYGKLKARDADPIVRAPRGGGGLEVPEGIINTMRESYDGDKPKSYPGIPVDEVATLVKLLREAANQVGCGVAIDYPHTVEDYTNRKGKASTRWVPTADERGNVRVTFHGRKRKERKEKETAPVAESTPAV